MALRFDINHTVPGARGRTGTLRTPHGRIETPALAAVGTKAAVKAVTPEELRDIGIQVVLGNTYHLYLEPGDELVREAGGLGAFMNWSGPTMTDSGGFQVFSLGAAWGESVSKVAEDRAPANVRAGHAGRGRRARVTDEGVWFRSHTDGRQHFFSPERSMEIQHNIGADIIFAFDECTSPAADKAYQKEALVRTHEWAGRCAAYHEKSGQPERQALFGIVQGGRHEDLRRQSARVIGAMPFPGFGIGGSFDKDDIDTAVGWVADELPEEKPRHLLGIGEPEDIFGAVLQGIDLFDCVAPTRLARTGTLYTSTGKVNIYNAAYRGELAPIDEHCSCYTCRNYTRAYVAHLATIHNLFFITTLMDGIRASIGAGRFEDHMSDFLARYQKRRG